MFDSVQPHRWQPNRLHHPWDSPGKNTGVSCHFLLQFMKVRSQSEVAQSCPTLRDPMDCSLPGSSVHGIFQARVLEWGAIAFSGKLPYGFLKSFSFYSFPHSKFCKWWLIKYCHVDTEIIRLLMGFEYSCANKSIWRHIIYCSYIL